MNYFPAEFKDNTYYKSRGLYQRPPGSLRHHPTAYYQGSPLSMLACLLLFVCLLDC